MRQHYIYFLRLKGEIVYVGISVDQDASRRVWYHRLDGKPFDTVEILDEAYTCYRPESPRCKGCGEGLLREIELIEKHSPILNVLNNPTGAKARIDLNRFTYEDIIGYAQCLLHTEWSRVSDKNEVVSRVIEEVLLQEDPNIFDMEEPAGFIYTRVRFRALDQLRKEERRLEFEDPQGLIIQ